MNMQTIKTTARQAVLAAAIATTATLAASADTYYMRGQDAAGKSSFSGARSANNIGWATTRTGTPVTTAPMSGNDFIIQSATRLRTGTSAGQTFGGATLTIEEGGEMFLKAGDLSTKVPGTVSFASLIGDGGEINHAVSNTQTINGGTVSVNAGKSLIVKLSPSNRTLIIASELVGVDTAELAVMSSFESGSEGQVLELQNAEGFSGTITGSKYTASATGTFVLKLTGGFSGTITSLPSDTTQVLVNYDGLPSRKGLRVATSTIPDPLKTALTLYTDKNATLSAGAAVMTFPAGTTVDPAEFTVGFAYGVSGTAATLPLATTENGDGTISLVVKDGSAATCVWTGEAGDGKMSTGGNWDGGSVPGAGAALDFSAVTAATAIAANGLTYGAVTMGAGVITFSGMLEATSFSDTAKIAIAANATVTLDGDLELSDKAANTTVIHSVASSGKFIVTGNIELTSTAKLLNSFASGSGDTAGQIVANGLVANKGSSSNTDFMLNAAADARTYWVIGENGISGTSRFWCQNNSSRKVNIYPNCSDFTISTVIGVAKQGSLAMITTGADGNAHKISFSSSGSINGGYGDNNSGDVYIKGTGTVELNNIFYGQNKVYLQDTATLSMKRGADAGNNALLSVASGATLEIAESAASAGAASVTRRGNLTLNDGAKLKFNFTDKRIAPVLGKTSGKTVSASGTIYVDVTATGIDKPRGGEHILTTCGGFSDADVELAAGVPDWVTGVSVNGDGNIVLDVKSSGTIFIIR